MARVVKSHMTESQHEALRAWRKYPDNSTKEIARLDLKKEIKELGWSPATVTRTMNRVASEAMFRLAVYTALEAQKDPPRLLARRSEQFYVDNPHQAMTGSLDAGEAIRKDCEMRVGTGRCCQKHITQEANERWEKHVEANRPPTPAELRRAA